MQYHFYQLLQLIALVTAFIYWRGLKQHRILLFIPLLILINATELIGNNFKAFGWANNYFVYNIYLLASTPLWLLLFSAMLSIKSLIKKVYFFIVVLIMLLLLLNYFFIQGTSMFNTYSLLIVMLLTIIFSCLILFSLTTTDDFNLPFFRHPYFWINASNLLFSLVTLVLLGLQQYIIANGIQLRHKSLYYAILPIVNIILYIGLTYAFLLCKPARNKY